MNFPEKKHHRIIIKQPKADSYPPINNEEQRHSKQ
jgi:hypothetical protein